MRLEDWRDLAPGQAATLYAAERTRWLRDLSWDLDDSWQIVESARQGGLLPGWVARDPDGGVAGWCYFLVRDTRLQIGALSGRRAATIRRLLDAVIGSPEATGARTYDGFLYPDSEAVVAALARRRFRLEPYHYLERTLAPGAACAPPVPALRPWDMADLPEAVRLLARAYAGSSGMRCFAPNGRLDEWTTYLSQMVRSKACGELALPCSFIAPGRDRAEGLVVTTWVGPGTAHVAQVAVAPDCWGRGLGRALLAASLEAARRHGAARATLLVAASNTAARRLYASLGFVERTRFVFGERAALTRVVQVVARAPAARISA
jgi:ribosomal protein S18 acetylase RimI-like enzyme